MTRKPRELRPDEVELWKKVAENTIRQHADRPEPRFPIEGVPHPVSKAKPKPKKPIFLDFRVGETAPQPGHPHQLIPDLSERLAQTPLRMDRKHFGKMKRGKLMPEARIDLHGMTIAQAHPALNHFIMAAHGSGKRLVLVITGKGKSSCDTGPMPTRTGILKHQVPHWLTTPPLGTFILQISEAHFKHGGSGAYYVYLRRPRG